MPLLACTPMATFDAKHPDQEFPRMVEAASRVHAARDACPSEVRVTVGVVHAEGDPDRVIPAIADVAAEHGATHYVVENAADDVEYVTTGAATQAGPVTLAHLRTREEVTRRMWATVYRCDRGR
jgi:hypothetical protein